MIYFCLFLCFFVVSVGYVISVIYLINLVYVISVSYVTLYVVYMIFLWFI